MWISRVKGLVPLWVPVYHATSYFGQLSLINWGAHKAIPPSMLLGLALKGSGLQFGASGGRGRVECGAKDA